MGLIYGLSYSRECESNISEERGRDSEGSDGETHGNGVGGWDDFLGTGDGSNVWFGCEGGLSSSNDDTLFRSERSVSESLLWEDGNIHDCELRVI